MHDLFQAPRPADSRKVQWLAELAERYIPYSYDPPIAGWLDATLVDHEKIIEAFRRRDEGAARSAMRDHVVKAGELLARSFEHARQDRSEDTSGAGAAGATPHEVSGSPDS
ncbi:hypothetical protein GCM10023215_45820 [Pseudonocardia yuanmonensis]|uniref:GntR C-terminal domain-containing protein n=1 Tax=Pseudonocardia yuanmonensis TaxID=1095914 RepID=A0ABP8X6D5_9PSEU